MGLGVDQPERRAFISHTEQKVSPKSVAELYPRAEILARLPLIGQRLIVSLAGGESYIGFVVEPYCLFLAYEVVDEEAARRLLPPGYELVPTTMFADGTPRICAILGAFNVHSSVFWGSRVELYLIAESTSTGLLTWVICDYESNTISYDPGEGFAGSTTSKAVITTSHAGEVLVDVVSRKRENRVTVAANLAAGSTRALEQRLWVEGNLSVDYGGRLMDANSVPFGLIFDPGEMDTALDIPLEAVDIEQNTFGEAFCAPEPFEVAVFPYAQHFLTSSYPRPTQVRDRAGLEEAVRGVLAD